MVIWCVIISAYRIRSTEMFYSVQAYFGLCTQIVMRNVDNLCETRNNIPNMLLILNNVTVVYWNRIAKRNIFFGKL